MRYGRVPKRSRERGGSTTGDDAGAPGTDACSPVTFADPSTTDSSDSCVGMAAGATAGASVETDSRQLLIYDTILTVTQAHHAHCAYTEEKTRAIVRTAVHVVSYYPIILLMIHFSLNPCFSLLWSTVQPSNPHLLDYEY